MGKAYKAMKSVTLLSDLLYELCCCTESKQEEEGASRKEITDLRIQAAKAQDILDSHRQVLDRLRVLQMNGPGPAVSISPATSSPQLQIYTSTSR